MPAGAPSAGSERYSSGPGALNASLRSFATCIVEMSAPGPMVGIAHHLAPGGRLGISYSGIALTATPLSRTRTVSSPVPAWAIVVPSIYRVRVVGQGSQLR